jgi:hypothetical protein
MIGQGTNGFKLRRAATPRVATARVRFELNKPYEESELQQRMLRDWESTGSVFQDLANMGYGNFGNPR